MNSVPNRGGPHRALSSAVQSMYESMPDNQLKAIHTQSKFIMEHGKSEHKAKHEDRLKYTTPEMERRKLSEAPPKSQRGVRDVKVKYGDPSTSPAGISGKRNPDIRYGDPSTQGGSVSGKRNPDIRYS